MNRSIVTAAIAGASIIGGFLLLRRTINKKFIDDSKSAPPSKDASDLDWLRYAVRLMQDVKPPPQSNFRVFAILTWENSTTGETGFIQGTNSEPCFIGGALCAERSAAVQLRTMPSECHVTAIYLTSDLQSDAITPGVLCREYLLSCVDIETPVHMCNTDLTVVNVSTLDVLYPYASCYTQVLRADIEDYAKYLLTRFVDPTTPLTRDVTSELIAAAEEKNKNELTGWQRLVKAALVMSKRDKFGQNMHPVMYGAAVLYSDGSIDTAWQKAGLEYGTTVDAVTGLLRSIDEHKERGIKPDKLVHIDNFGILHAPFAPARAQLYERGYEHVRMRIHHIPTGQVHVMTIKDLVPQCPQMSELWG